jgi:hypothetical protein
MAGQVRALVEPLCALTEEDWRLYVFDGDPLSGKLTREQKLDLAAKAADCGRELAARLAGDQGPLSAAERIAALGGKLVLPPEGNGGPMPLFASFTEPDLITVYPGNAWAADRLRQEAGLEDLMGPAPTREVLLAHELFHLLEYRDPGIFTRQKHLLLWKLGRWENRSSLFCLSEMAAMAFAQALTGLACSVYVLDVVMLYAGNPQLALEKRQAILDFVRRKAE